MTMIYEIQHLTARRRSPYPSARSLSPSALAPSGRCFSYSCDIGAPRPTRSRVTYDRQQVSWLAGYRLRPPSQRFFGLQWYLWPSAIRLQLRGQPRICTRICAHRIPLVSPFGHYQSQTWHLIVLRVNCRIGFHTGLPPLLGNEHRQLRRGHTDDRLMPSSKLSIWRTDIDALAFQPGEHSGLCMVHRRAFRALLRVTPSPRECIEFFNAHQEAFQAAARAKLLRINVTKTANFHLTSRDVGRQLEN